MFTEVKKEIKLMVPENAYNKFVMVKEDAENSYLDIQFHHNENFLT